MSSVTPKPAVLDYPDYIKRLRGQEPVLAEELAGFHGVENVLQWMEQRGLCQQKQTIDLVGQDEFSYDFLLQLEPAGRWLVFGVT
jgi:hypothetical protein